VLRAEALGAAQQKVQQLLKRDDELVVEDLDATARLETASSE